MLQSPPSNFAHVSKQLVSQKCLSDFYGAHFSVTRQSLYWSAATGGVLFSRTCEWYVVSGGFSSHISIKSSTGKYNFIPKYCQIKSDLRTSSASFKMRPDIKFTLFLAPVGAAGRLITGWLGMPLCNQSLSASQISSIQKASWAGVCALMSQLMIQVSSLNAHVKLPVIWHYLTLY